MPRILSGPAEHDFTLLKALKIITSLMTTCSASQIFTVPAVKVWIDIEL